MCFCEGLCQGNINSYASLTYLFNPQENSWSNTLNLALKESHQNFYFHLSPHCSLHKSHTSSKHKLWHVGCGSVVSSAAAPKSIISMMNSSLELVAARVVHSFLHYSSGIYPFIVAVTHNWHVKLTEFKIFIHFKIIFFSNQHHVWYKARPHYLTGTAAAGMPRVL